MKNLLLKELKLALHPTNIVFLLLSAMLLIPSYPYYVAFFYTTLGLFFICLGGRENHDIEYSLLLPIKKSRIVTARILFCSLLELLQLAAGLLFVLLHNALNIGANDVGMDANLSLIALSLPMFGLFNLLFFTRYYRNPAKIGGGFFLGSVAVFLYMGVLEVMAHIVPFMRDVLDTPDPEHLAVKLAVLAGGLLVFGLLTYFAHQKAVKSFEKLDF